jgi:hypothetical protein
MHNDAPPPTTSQVFYCHCYTCGSKTPSAEARDPNATEDWVTLACDKCHGDDGTVWVYGKCQKCGTLIPEWTNPELWDMCSWCDNT